MPATTLARSSASRCATNSGESSVKRNSVVLALPKSAFPCHVFSPRAAFRAGTIEHCRTPAAVRALVGRNRPAGWQIIADPRSPGRRFRARCQRHNRLRHPLSKAPIRLRPVRLAELVVQRWSKIGVRMARPPCCRISASEAAIVQILDDVLTASMDNSDLNPKPRARIAKPRGPRRAGRPARR